MATWRILKEKAVPKKQRTDDLSSLTKFVDTGETFEGDRTEADAYLETLQAEQGGCFALELMESSNG
ncbi:hypothetical protein NKH69_00090 [Mesorhizobium sp. M0976]|uniref:hypothetical protein n=1 Tax=Mesorhizobium sp. M0976 TaxID=2957038 RepID=UPI00333D9DD1